MWLVASLIGLAIPAFCLMSPNSLATGASASSLLASCTNHILQHKLTLFRYAAAHAALPAVETAEQALQQMMNEPEGAGLQVAGDWASACPESNWEDGSLGYIYLGSGISTGLLVGKDAPLILICPAKNHQANQEWNVIQGVERRRVRGAMAYRELLESHLAAGRTGRIPYASQAMSKLAAQLDSLPK